jgi:hypothetical protein
MVYKQFEAPKGIKGKSWNLDFMRLAKLIILPIQKHLTLITPNVG